jgi:hypothetical protein
VCVCVGKSQFLLHWQKCCYFHDSEELGTFGKPNQIFGTLETDLSKTHKRGTSLGKLGQMRALPLYYVSVWDSSWYYISSIHFSKFETTFST